MVKTMTKGSLSSSSSGSWLFLFLGVAFLLPTTLSTTRRDHLQKTTVLVELSHRRGQDCRVLRDLTSEFNGYCSRHEDFCVTRWLRDQKPDDPGTPIGCASKEKFLEDYGFNPSDGKCKESKKKKDEFLCACNHDKKTLCNYRTLGERKAQKWRKGGSSKASNLLPPVTFLAALLILTIFAILAC